MSLKNIFSTMKSEGYVVHLLDRYLLSIDATDDSRAKDVNAPSRAGEECLRAHYYARTGAPSDSNFIDPRTRRIFDNGTGVHVRLQNYLLEQGILLMDEVPVLDFSYNIQGHTDGLLRLTPAERGVLEIKSINSNAFSTLKDAKDEHKKQGLIYLHCLETRRKALQAQFSSLEDLQEKWDVACAPLLAERYSHLKSGSKYTAEEKLQFQLGLHRKADEILYSTKIPLTKVVFLYENKDTQALKEFTVTSVSAESKNNLDSLLKMYHTVNLSVSEGKLPERLGENKSSNVCRWCNYKVECWG